MSSVMKAEKVKKVKAKKAITSEMKSKVIEKLITARVGLLMKHPFFGNLSTRMQLVDATDWCSTLATDGRNFYYNVEFVDQLTPKEVEFGFGHEVLHNVFDHLGRRGSRDPMLSNIAADYAANQILKDERIGVAPASIKIFQDDKYRGFSYEQIYEDLLSKCEKINFQELGTLLDEHLDDEPGSSEEGKGPPAISAEERKKIRDEIKEAIIAAVQSSGAGKVPGSILRVFNDLTESKMNWRELLRLNIQSILKNNFSFSKPNRKSQHSGAVLPGIMQDEAISISVAVDMSGSISDKQVKDFLSEIKGIMDQYSDYEIDLWSFDTEVYNYMKFTSDNGEDITEYQPKGGGGTDFDVNFKFMKDNEILPKKFIMFTDCYPCGSWGDPDYCDTLFICHGNPNASPPFGQIAHYTDN